MLGRHIETLVDEMKIPGRFTVQWDASSQVSGTYFYRLEAMEFMNTGTMVLIK